MSARVSFTLPLPDAAAALMPVTAALVQVNVAPAVELDGAYVKGTLSQIAAGVSVLVKVGVVRTVIVS